MSSKGVGSWVRKLVVPGLGAIALACSGASFAVDYVHCTCGSGAVKIHVSCHSTHDCGDCCDSWVTATFGLRARLPPSAQAPSRFLSEMKSEEVRGSFSEAPPAGKEDGTEASANAGDARKAGAAESRRAKQNPTAEHDRK